MSSRVFTKDIMRDGVFTQENERRRMRTIFEAGLLFALKIMRFVLCLSDNKHLILLFS